MKTMRHSRNSEHYAALRAWLKQQRSKSGLTIRALAEKLGVSHSIVGKVAGGSRKLELLEFVEYCEALGVDSHEGLDIVITSLRGPVATSRS